ncbi:hypothetical protein JI435_425800 [Parastagonospora nodorum SN15]|uniref:Uncharacterized protein n=1 Tax=Phaeosphaeria nodorum (strain SN15 / ATCC MYA-4574 / FGSC 10173) TaxID=321614 RepID=A0A7U2ET65_PHANO|nr:hypothetical protein HBH51_014120 [Parastagonospora nodorum]QRC90649.1 hypothetical protein JI435_425800 [Parastagonospora nodorum SN15]KAH3987531.1 hypothetical protein HBH52_032950 [Parastagonospora nodorum]KAH4001270.1 hypothetical protein HBI10_092940 [Parastagonospora nodorum]KAH4033615.1 hypothetical protein HBI13_012810 [Parastagonospora nodorum]
MGISEATVKLFSKEAPDANMRAQRWAPGSTQNVSMAGIFGVNSMFTASQTWFAF